VFFLFVCDTSRSSSAFVDDWSQPQQSFYPSFPSIDIPGAIEATLARKLSFVLHLKLM